MKIKLYLVLLLFIIFTNVGLLAKNTALIIGTGENRLGQQASRNSKNFASFIEDYGKNFDIIRIYDNFATKETVEYYLNKLKNTSKGDAVLIHITVHGIKRIDNDVSLVFYGTQGQNYITGNEILEYLNQMGSERAIVIIDACHSGVFSGKNITKGKWILTATKGDEAAGSILVTREKGNIFTHELITAFKNNTSLISAFKDAKSKTSNFWNTVQRGFSKQTPQMYPINRDIDLIEIFKANQHTNIHGTVTDIDGNVYKTIQIGDQLWMAENLKVTHYQTGDPIPNVTNNEKWSNLTTGAYCVYDNNPSNAETYGNLYNWLAVDDSRGLAPEGWHVPTDNDWKELEMYLGMRQSQANAGDYRGTNEGSKLAGKADLWVDGELINNSEFGKSGFTALPGGHRFSSNGKYYSLGASGSFWSSTKSYSTIAWCRILTFVNTAISRVTHKGVKIAFSVRCLKD